MNLNRHILSLLFILLSGVLYAQSSGSPYDIGRTYTIHSLILEQERPVIISVPDGYVDSKKSYPVLYLLDGEGNFLHTSASVRFLERSGRIPEMILVGIKNTDDRARDLTPEASSMKDNFPTSGGADKMLEFIEDELMPYVSENYRANDYNLLVGHSFGGLFAIHALVNHPGIFDSYLAISPSLWWDKQSLAAEQSKAFFANHQDLIGHLYMTMGNEGGDMLGGAWKLAALFEEANQNDFKWHFELMPEETHGTVPFLSTYEGLQYIFEDWNKNELREKVDKMGVQALDDYETKIKKLYRFEADWDERWLLDIGRRMMDQEKTAEAVLVFEKAISAFPESSKAWFQYGESLARAEKPAEAINALQKSMSFDKENFQSIALLKQLGEDVSDLLPSIELSKSELKKYVGAYEIDAGPSLSINTDGKQLFAEATILPKEEIVPLGDHVFYVISKDAKITFTVEDKIATKVLISTPDGSFEGKRK